MMTLTRISAACPRRSSSASTAPALAGQAPGLASAPDIPVSHHDRVYAAEQFSNTVSVTDPANNKLLGVIRLGDPQPGNFSPLYRGQVLVHGMGFSPDHKTLAVVSIGSNSVTFIDTATNASSTSPMSAARRTRPSSRPTAREVWVTVRGEDYVAVLDGKTSRRRPASSCRTGRACRSSRPTANMAMSARRSRRRPTSSRSPTTRSSAKVTQASPFCPNIAATPDGKQVWFTLKDTGKTQVFDASPPFALLKTLDTGPITNHVNFVRNAKAASPM